MSTKLDMMCRALDINLSKLSKRIGMDYNEIVKILDGDKTPNPHSLKTLMYGIEYYAGRSFTDAESIDLLSPSDGEILTKSLAKPSITTQIIDAENRRVRRKEY